MQPEMSACLRRGAVKRVVAGLLLLLWLNVLAFAALPQLHTAIHRDASKAEHQCVITVILQGKYHFSEPVVASARPQPVTLIGPAIYSSVFLPTIPHRLAPGRAPPVATAPLA
jgi:hypothetical protein